MLKQESPSEALLFLPCQKREKYKPRQTIMTIPPAQLSTIVYIAGEDVLLGQKASSNPMLDLNGMRRSRRMLP